MKIAVILVAYHSQEKIKELQRRISSAEEKIIVVDNDKENRGFAGGVNKGIRIALKEKYSHVLLINPDLDITPQEIKKLATNKADIVGPILKFQRGHEWIYDHGGKINWFLGRTGHFESHEAKIDSYENDIDYISGACMLVSVKVFEKIGLFDERFFMYFEDADFCLRAKKTGFSVGVNSEVIVEHQISEHRYSRNTKKLEYLLQSNLTFINKWVPWYFKPTAYAYWLALSVKSWVSVKM